MSAALCRLCVSSSPSLCEDDGSKNSHYKRKAVKGGEKNSERRFRKQAAMAATLLMMRASVAAPYNSTFAPYNDTYKPPYNNTYRCTAWTTLATTVKYCDGPGGKHPSDLNKLLGPKCSVSSGAQRGNGCCWQPLGYDDGPAFGSKCSAVCASQGYMAPRAGLDTAYCRSSDGKPFGNCCAPAAATEDTASPGASSRQRACVVLHSLWPSLHPAYSRHSALVEAPMPWARLQ